MALFSSPRTDISFSFPLAALGESDPTYPALLEALKKVKSQTQVRPVDERTASTRTFLERAQKRIGPCREEVARAQEVLTQAQAKLQSEEQALVEGEARLAALTAESVAPREDVPPTVPANFAHELVELRACVQELRRENTDLRSELQRTERSGRERPEAGQEFIEFHSRLGPSEREWRRSRRIPRRTRRCFSQDGNDDRQCRLHFAFESFQPIVRLTGNLTRRVPGLDGFKGMRVGEASHPGPSHVQSAPTADDSMEVVSALEFDMTQLDSDLDVGGSDTESCAADAPPASVMPPETVG